jgi:hypothetical protein
MLSLTVPEAIIEDAAAHGDEPAAEVREVL